MRSALYECNVTHERFGEPGHRFVYRLFTFALDLAEIDALVARIPWLSRNRFNLFSYFDGDHVDIEALLRTHGVTEKVGRTLLVTHLRMAGYVFNPVSFFFCFDEDDRPLAAVAEVNNTYGERKPYVIRRDGLRDSGFESTQRKYFYISPFLDLDVDLRLRLAIPGPRLGMVIDDLRGDELLLRATLTGARVPLTAGRLLWFAVKYPLMTLRVIAAIHWQALRLWWKGIPYLRKHERPDLQRGLLEPEKR